MIIAPTIDARIWGQALHHIISTLYRTLMSGPQPTASTEHRRLDECVSCAGDIVTNNPPFEQALNLNVANHLQFAL